ncbi:MAG: RNA-binding S4 domain-containing protein [Clostridia bacterium]|nr:RNA-binding S4 domain-containing protein [Clostridia bacterium]
MRLDKYLKVSRIIKRRTVACEACEQGKVTVNGKVAKPAQDVKERDVIEVTFGERVMKVEVVAVAEHVLKGDAQSMYKIL